MSNTGAHASVVIQKLKRVGVTHIVGLPDNASAALFTLVQKDSDLHLITVTREGEAFAIASGLWIGGKLPVVVLQNTGLLESGDSLRGTASRIGVPLLILVTCRGWEKLLQANVARTPVPIPRELLVRPDVDSVAFMTEPTLVAWGIPFARYASDVDEQSFDRVWQIASTQERPAALLITQTLI